MQRTFILVKPDGIQRGKVGEVISRIENKGLKLVALKMLWMDKTMAETHYGVHKGKPFFNGLVKFITSSPLVAAVFEGKDAVDVVRKLMGETDPVKATPGTIRGDFGLDIGQNIVHGSDSIDNAQKEIALFFKDNETFDYRREIDRWIIEF